MYCVKCKQHTDTKDAQQVVTKNGRNMKRGICLVCGSVKTQFVKSTPTGGSINSLINKLPIEVHLPGHSFTGPGTKLNVRLNDDGTPKSWSKPINRVDDAAYRHDVCYARNTDTKTRNKVCDKAMLSDLEGIVNPTLRERLDRSLVARIIGTKARFGWGHGEEKKSPSGQINWLRSSTSP